MTPLQRSALKQLLRLRSKDLLVLDREHRHHLFAAQCAGLMR